MVFSFRNTKEKQQSLLNVQEVNNVWDILKARYASYDQLLVWTKYAHDVDFKAILKSYKDDINKDIESYEKLTTAFAINCKLVSYVKSRNTGNVFKGNKDCSHK